MAASKRGYFRIITRPRQRFAAFCGQDVAEPSIVQRLTERGPTPGDKTQTWLLSKEMAHVEKGRIVPDTKEAADLLATFGREPVHRTDDLFEVL